MSMLRNEEVLLNFLNTLKRHNNYHTASLNVNQVITTFYMGQLVGFLYTSEDLAFVYLFIYFVYYPTI